MGFNRAGLRFLQQQLEMKNITFFEEASENLKKRKSKTKKIVAFMS